MVAGGAGERPDAQVDVPVVAVPVRTGVPTFGASWVRAGIAVG